MSLSSTDMILIIMTAIQSIEMWLIVINHKKTNHLLENPGPLITEGLVQLTAQIQNNEKARNAIAALVCWSASTAIQSVRGTISEAGIKPPKIKSIGDVFSFLLQMPKIQAAVEQKIAKTAGIVGDASAETAAAGWGGL